MTDQALPDDLLIFITEEYLNPSTGQSDRERLEAIKNISLTSKALALASRRFIFERTKIIAGGALQGVDPLVVGAVEELKCLFEANPSYFGFVKRLRIESRLAVFPTGKEAPTSNDLADSVEDYAAYLDDLGQENVLSLHYASSSSEEATLCWLLSQRFPNLDIFHFTIRPINTSKQVIFRATAFTSPSLISSPKWSYSSLPSQQGSEERVIATCLPEAIVRFLGAEDQPLERLILSSNLPPRILQYLNKSKPLKYLCLTKFSEVMPLLRNQVEVPFFLGMNKKSLAILEDKIEVEKLSCDVTGGATMHWVKGPHCYINLGRLKALQLTVALEDTIRFPFHLCSESLSTLKLLHLDSSIPWLDMQPLRVLRKLILGCDLRHSDSIRGFNQIRYCMDRVNTTALETIEIDLRVADPADPAVIDVLTNFNRYLSPRISTEYANLKTLRVVVGLSDVYWGTEGGNSGYTSLKGRIRAPFGPLVDTQPQLRTSAQPVLVDVDVVNENESSLWLVQAW